MTKAEQEEFNKLKIENELLRQLVSSGTEIQVKKKNWFDEAKKMRGVIFKKYYGDKDEQAIALKETRYSVWGARELYIKAVTDIVGFIFKREFSDGNSSNGGAKSIVTNEEMYQKYVDTFDEVTASICEIEQRIKMRKLSQR